MTSPRCILLSVSPLYKDHAMLSRLLGTKFVTIRRVRNCREAIEALELEAASVVICTRDLPDGSWEDVLNRALVLKPAPPVIVTSRVADERLWASVLNLGGFDVLLKPFDTREVT